jgi:hypothetical protein
MGKINEVHSIIVPAQSANFSAHTYTEIYGGTAGCPSVVINGVTVAVGASSSIFVNIRSISSGTGCFLLGENKDVYTGSDRIG